MRIHPRIVAAAMVLATTSAVSPASALAATTAPPPSPVSGYTVVNSGPVSTASSMTLNGVAYSSVTCPATSAGVQRKPLDGGVTIDSHSPLVSVADSYPGGTQWYGEVANRTGKPVTYEVWATCAVPTSGYTQVYSQNVPFGVKGAVTPVNVTCPKGTVVTGGGGMTSLTTNFVNEVDSYPSGNTWVVDYRDEATLPVYLYAGAVCSSPLAGYVADYGPQLRAAPGGVVTATATCPVGPDVALGGGDGVSTLYSNVLLNSSAPESSGLGWSNYEENQTTVGIGVTPWVICGSTSATPPAKAAT
jgi:hypothetical protein